MTGGWSLLRGMKVLVANELGVPTVVVENAEASTIFGVGRIVEDLATFEGMLLPFPPPLAMESRSSDASVTNIPPGTLCPGGLMANHPRPIVLGEAERVELERLMRSSSVAAGLSRRARVVLLMAADVSGAEIARMTGYTTAQVSRLRRRFAEEGIDGLADKPRSGRPPSISDRKRAKIVAMTLKAPGRGRTHWSTRELATEVGVSHMTIHRIWKAHDLKPHQVETFKFTTDPEAEEKIHDVVGLCLNPPAKAVVLSLDEKTQIQVLNRTQPLLPLRPGIPARQTHDYNRNGLTSLYAALEVTSGEVIGECRPRHTGADFLEFLKLVAARYRRTELHVILDNSSTHKTPEVKAWLEAHPSVHFHFTPTGASWLNMVETWFSILTRKSVRRGSFNSVKALVRHIRNYIDHWNDNPVPFIWTKEPADIISKAVRRPHQHDFQDGTLDCDTGAGSSFRQPVRTSAGAWE